MNPFVRFLATMAASLVGTHVTYWLVHRRRMNSLRAASLTSLVFVVLAQATHLPWLLSLQPALFGSTYVAMSEPFRLPERHVLLAGLVFGVLLFGLQVSGFLHFHGGMGGTLGGAAFVACLAVFWLKQALNRPAV